jgi:hypothetical protein
VALARGGTRPSRNQFNLTVNEESAALLRSEAKRLRTKATTLAGRLLERALTERAGDASGGVEGLRKLRADVQALTRAHHNATLKLLVLTGKMSSAEANDWAKRHLRRP